MDGYECHGGIMLQEETSLCKSLRQEYPAEYGGIPWVVLSNGFRMPSPCVGLFPDPLVIGNDKP
ncbi:hypothetical protein GXY_01253 [Novacetimonas hansenii ATCC 23769]|uniref:Uncharacterized protein n=1 Tax=Novacetimonas hansenii ATCC 23769 TaxID=714995 RepID=D5QAX7_NOVHA|nr:hypothetical protein GXY_01253 [Novacetimonas hansenii ATCC 23769]